MNYLAAAFALLSALLSLGWYADGQKHAVELGELRLELTRKDLDIAAAGRAAEQHARAVEAGQDAITWETDHAYQKDRARLARVPVERLRQRAAAEALGNGIRPAPLPHTAGSADAESADPVPDPGCRALDRLAVDAAETTLMLHRLQRWAEGIEHSCNAISAAPEADE